MFMLQKIYLYPNSAFKPLVTLMCCVAKKLIKIPLDIQSSQKRLKKVDGVCAKKASSTINKIKTFLRPNRKRIYDKKVIADS